MFSMFYVFGKGIILSTSDASADWSAHLQWCPHAKIHHVAVLTMKFVTFNHLFFLRCSSILVTKFRISLTSGDNRFVMSSCSDCSRSPDVWRLGRSILLFSFLASNYNFPTLRLLVLWLVNSWCKLEKCNWSSDAWLGFFVTFDIRLRFVLSWDQRWALIMSYCSLRENSFVSQLWLWRRLCISILRE